MFKVEEILSSRRGFEPRSSETDFTTSRPLSQGLPHKKTCWKKFVIGDWNFSLHFHFYCSILKKWFQWTDFSTLLPEPGGGDLSSTWCSSPLVGSHWCVFTLLKLNVHSLSPALRWLGGCLTPWYEASLMEEVELCIQIAQCEAFVSWICRTNEQSPFSFHFLVAKEKIRLWFITIHRKLF